jgi:hypothetical protein
MIVTYWNHIAMTALSHTERLNLCTNPHCCVYLYAGETA